MNAVRMQAASSPAEAILSAKDAKAAKKASEHKFSFALFALFADWLSQTQGAKL